jgi:hypothetical protein
VVDDPHACYSRLIPERALKIDVLPISILSVSLIAIFCRGLTLTQRFWLTLVLAPITIALVVALVADLDSPSTGLIRVEQRAVQRLKSEFSSE